MYEGTIKFFDTEKGFGFIETDALDGDQDAFVHHSDCKMTGFVDFDDGDPVRFDLIDGEEGPKAVDVRKVG